MLSCMCISVLFLFYMFIKEFIHVDLHSLIYACFKESFIPVSPACPSSSLLMPQPSVLISEKAPTAVF